MSWFNDPQTRKKLEELRALTKGIESAIVTCDLIENPSQGIKLQGQLSGLWMAERLFIEPEKSDGEEN